MPYRSKIPDWPESERPREKLVEHGADSLTDTELLAIILRVGGKQMTAIDLARHILQTCDGFRGIDKMSVKQLEKVHGLGRAKIAQIKAAIAIGKRLASERSEDQRRISGSDDIYQLVRLKYRDLHRERFGIVFLTSRNRVMGDKVLFEGGLTESLVSPREVIREILNAGAGNVVLIHNHPSGEVTPSDQDIFITRKLKKACEAIDVTVLDHLIIGNDGYYSFADEEKL